MSQKLMTNSQGLYLAKTGRHIGYLTEFTPPTGGRVHILWAKVRLDRDWQKAINAAGPRTPRDCTVREVANLYPPTKKGTVEREYILLNNDGASYAAALDWGKQNKLNQTVPREVFAISEHNPRLHQQLGLTHMYLVGTTNRGYEGDRQACYVWWFGTERRAGLYWIEHFGTAGDWFAFSRDLTL